MTTHAFFHISAPMGIRKNTPRIRGIQRKSSNVRRPGLQSLLSLHIGNTGILS